MQEKTPNKKIHYFARSWRKFDSCGFVSIMGVVNQIGESAYIEFHINVNETIEDGLVEQLSDYLNQRGHKLIIYRDSFFDEYARQNGIDEEKIQKFKIWKWIYHLLLYRYLYVEHGITYLTSLDDDLVFDDKQRLGEVIHCIENRIPFSIKDQYWDADKPMMGKLCVLFGAHIFDQYLECYSNEMPGNSGFMGISNDMFEYFKTPEQLNSLIDLFEYREWNHLTMANKGLGYRDYKILLQEQSFLSILNRAFSHGTHVVLGEDVGITISNDIEETKKSKLQHYIGLLKYTEYYTKLINLKRAIYYKQIRDFIQRK